MKKMLKKMSLCEMFYAYLVHLIKSSGYFLALLPQADLFGWKKTQGIITRQIPSMFVFKK